MSNAIAWLNLTSRSGVYAGHVEGVLVGVVTNGTSPPSVQVKLQGAEAVTETCKTTTSLVNPLQENVQFSVHASGKSYVAYLGQKRNSADYSIALYKRDELSDSALDALFDAPVPTSEEADPPF